MFSSSKWVLSIMDSDTNQKSRFLVNKDTGCQKLGTEWHYTAGHVTIILLCPLILHHWLVGVNKFCQWSEGVAASLPDFRLYYVGFVWVSPAPRHWHFEIMVYVSVCLTFIACFCATLTPSCLVMFLPSVALWWLPTRLEFWAACGCMKISALSVRTSPMHVMYFRSWEIIKNYHDEYNYDTGTNKCQGSCFLWHAV